MMQYMDMPPNARPLMPQQLLIDRAGDRALVSDTAAK